MLTRSDTDWATAALSVVEVPDHWWRGLSYGEASRKAQAVCQVAGVTGQTLRASVLLANLVEHMKSRLSFIELSSTQSRRKRRVFPAGEGSAH